MIDEWQRTTGNMVYHVIKNNLEFELCYSFLYVSEYENEWDYDREQLLEGYPMAYVKNIDDDSWSELSSIGVKPMMRAFLRTA